MIYLAEISSLWCAMLSKQIITFAHCWTTIIQK